MNQTIQPIGRAKRYAAAPILPATPPDVQPNAAAVAAARGARRRFAARVRVARAVLPPVHAERCARGEGRQAQ